MALTFKEVNSKIKEITDNLKTCGEHENVGIICFTFGNTESECSSHGINVREKDVNRAIEELERLKNKFKENQTFIKYDA